MNCWVKSASGKRNAYFLLHGRLTGCFNEKLKLNSCGFFPVLFSLSLIRSDIEKIKSTGATYMAASGKPFCYLTFLIN